MGGEEEYIGVMEGIFNDKSTTYQTNDFETMQRTQRTSMKVSKVRMALRKEIQKSNTFIMIISFLI